MGLKGFLHRSCSVLKPIARALCGAGLMFIAVAAAAAEHTWYMDLRWNFLKLGQVTFVASTTDDEERFEIIGRTAGPLRWVKNYDGRGLLERKGEREIYTLQGTDGGVNEIRRIVFEHGELPRVLEFKDSAAERYLEPAEPWGSQAWSPMALVDRVLKSAEYPKLCAGQFTVFDGKRRYEVLLSATTTPKASSSVDANMQRLAQCTAILLGASLYEVGQSSPNAVQDEDRRLALEMGSSKKMRQVWLFGRGDRRIDFTFMSECGDGLLSEMKFHSALGVIVGGVSAPCSS